MIDKYIKTIAVIITTLIGAGISLGSLYQKLDNIKEVSAKAYEISLTNSITIAEMKKDISYIKDNIKECK